MISIGSMDRRLSVERAASVPNTLNEPEETWGNLATVWARRRDVSDGEKEASGQIGSTLMSRFVIRSTPQSRNFLTTDRLKHDGGTWNIQGIKQLDDGRDRFLEITAIRDLDNGQANSPD